MKSRRPSFPPVPSSGPVISVRPCGSGIGFDPLSQPFSIRSTKCRKCLQRFNEWKQLVFLREEAFVQPLQQCPIFEHVVSRRDERLRALRNNDQVVVGIKPEGAFLMIDRFFMIVIRREADRREDTVDIAVVVV